MPKKLITKELEITAGTGAISWDINEWVDTYHLHTPATITLTSSITITASATPDTGTEFLIYYGADLDFNGNTVSVFGTLIPEALQSTKMWFRAYYFDGAWGVTVMSDFAGGNFITESMLGASAVSSTVLADNAVTADKVVANSLEASKFGVLENQYVLTYNVSFDAGGQSDNAMIIPFNSVLNTITYCVVGTIEATGPAFISPLIGGVATFPSSVSIAGGAVTNDIVTTTIKSSNAITAGQEVHMRSHKTAPGGSALLTLTFTRT